jgi:hypothetical protein
MPRIRLIALLPALLAAGALAAEDAPASPAPGQPDLESGFGIGPSFRVLYASLEGDAFAERDTVTGTTVDLRHDLDLTGREPLFEVGVVGGWWDPWSPGVEFRYGFEVRYLGGRFSERAALDAPKTFDTGTFPAGSVVRSAFSYDLTEILFGGACRFGDERRYAEVGVFVGSAIISGRLRMNDPATGMEAHEGLTSGTLGGGLRFTLAPCRWFDIGGEAGFYGWSYEEDWEDWDSITEEASLIDLSIHASVRPWKYAAIEVGYRYLNNHLYHEHVDEDYPWTLQRNEQEFNWTIQGPYIGATIRF